MSIDTSITLKFGGETEKRKTHTGNEQWVQIVTGGKKIDGASDFFFLALLAIHIGADRT